MDPIRVVIADDDTSVRTALADLLEADPRVAVVAQLADGADLVETVAGTGAHVVLLDVRMPGGGGEAARALRNCPVTVVAVSAETAVDTVLELLRAGASGYLAKGRLGPVLADAVVRCAAGEVVLAVPTAALALRRLTAGQ